ncbi:MAG: endolytic transglycosylase MltG [Muribaculaceae bacterium]|nr:endolytic transglycosylase MltG [Muribaculaceae bacterium]
MTKPKKPLGRHPFIWAAISCGLILVIIILCFVWPLFFSKSRNAGIIKIPAGATEQVVKDSLTKYFGEKYASDIVRIAKFRKSDFSNRHGAYMIDSGIPPIKAERILTHGVQHPFTITINCFRGKKILADKVSSKLDFTPDSLEKVISDPNFLDAYNLDREQGLALFIDDSYQFYWSASPKSVAEKIGKHYNQIWNEERRKKAEALGLSPAEIIILASIADEETNKADEKGKVARLYMNRIKKGMKLQADPTVKFALGDFSLRRIRSKHLEADSPYNTYKVNGLPPGPIRTVTVADIDAVLNAGEHDYLYMCAKDDFSGYHFFAKDYNTHMQNARKYQKALNRRNIK